MESKGVGLRGRALVSLAAAMLAASGGAAEAGGAASLRLGRGDGFERIVIDLPAGARVTRHAGAGAVLLEVVGAAAPAEPPDLSALGIELASRGASAFELRAERDPRRLRAFLLAGPRLVVDLARAAGPLPLPPDATPVPEGAALAASEARSEVAEASAPADPPRPRAPEPALESGSGPAPGPEPAPATAPTPESAPRAAGAPGGEAPLELKTLILVGVEGSGVSVDEVMALELQLTETGEVVDAPSATAPVERMRLSELARNRATALPITRAALDSIAQQIAAVYTEKGLSRPDVFVLVGPSVPRRRAKPDGRIVMLVRPSAAAAVPGTPR